MGSAGTVSRTGSTCWSRSSGSFRIAASNPASKIAREIACWAIAEALLERGQDHIGDGMFDEAAVAGLGGREGAVLGKLVGGGAAEADVEVRARLAALGDAACDVV